MRSSSLFSWLPSKLCAEPAADPIALILEHRRTMTNERRLKHLQYWCTRFRHTDHAFVECGVAKGGCIALMKHCAGPRNTVWGFDTFGGLPAQTAEDEGDGAQWVGYVCAGPEGQDAVWRTFSILELDRARVHIVEGLFEQTLEQHKERMGSIAALRLDNDWYSSTKYCLETLYDAVIPGGVILLDDYGTFHGCRKAVDEFRKKKGITAPLAQSDEHEYFWIKEAA